MLAGDRHDLESAIQVIQLRAGSILAEGLVQSQVMFPGKVSADRTLLRLMPIDEQIGPQHADESAGTLQGTRLFLPFGQERFHHAVKV